MLIANCVQLAQEIHIFLVRASGPWRPSQGSASKDHLADINLVMTLTQCTRQQLGSDVEAPKLGDEKSEAELSLA